MIRTYTCTTCGTLQDITQKLSDDILSDCPVCLKPTLETYFGTPPAVIFKGSGWTPKHSSRGK